MKLLPPLTLALVVALSAACSSPQDSSAPAEQKPAEQALGKRSQAVTGLSLVEVAVSPEVRAVAGTEATVRAFRIEGAEGPVSVADVMQPALLAGASDASQPWAVDQERDAEATRAALKYLTGLVPAIEAEAGTAEAFRSGYAYWFTTLAVDSCRHGDFYVLLFQGRLYTIEAAGDVTC